jgi:putative aldouronate transport system permease protein
VRGHMLKRATAEDLVVDSVNYLLLFVIMIITLYPFYYVLVISFNQGLDTMMGGVYFWPREFTLDNYSTFFSDPKWMMAFVVSVLRTVIGTFLGVLFTCMVAYGLAHKDLMFKKLYFSLVIFAMYFSGGLIPYYVVLKSLHLLNSFAVYVIPSMLNTFFLLIAISFFRELPGELEESAKVDGANEIYIFLKIIIPISLPMVATMALFLGVGQWNSWLDSAFFVQDDNLRTLTYRMIEIINQSSSPRAEESQLYAGQASSVTSFSLQVTAMVVAIVPVMCVYPFLQKYFVKGIMLGSVKG